MAGLIYWLHSRHFESTDGAEIDTHLNPVSSRIDGTITNVYVDDNQVVKTGEPLVDLDPGDYQAALDEALAQLEGARSMVVAQQPNVPITQVENTTNIASAEADVYRKGARTTVTANTASLEAAAQTRTGAEPAWPISTQCTGTGCNPASNGSVQSSQRAECRGSG